MNAPPDPSVSVDWDAPVGPIKPVNGVGQPPMVGELAGWPMMRHLREAGVPYSRLHDVGGWMGKGLYVDIPNLFRDFGADETKPENYDFAYTDALLAKLVENGVEPYFRLGVTIENFVGAGFPRRNTKPPPDFAKWARVCERVVRHYTEGWADGFRMKIEHWEIWNEPDNEPEPDKNPMWGASFDEYLKLYGTAAPRLKRAFPHLKIGGYGSCGFYAGVGSGPAAGANASPRTAHFVECAKRFLAAARAGGWPLDFFSYHTYSQPAEAVRQTRYAAELLRAHGFDRTALHCNEWLPGAWHEATGTAAQAAWIAAEMVGFQHAPCDLACLYDARCGVGAYSPLFNPMTCKPHRAYHALAAFAELRTLGTAVRTVGSADERDGDGLWVLAARGADGRRAALVVNPTTRARPLPDLFGGARVRVRAIDAAHAFDELPAAPAAVGKETVLLLQDGRAAAPVV